MTTLGAEMVIMFFVLSGFAMAHSIAHTSSVRRFYLKRLIRIWPPYIAATLLAAAVAGIAGIKFNLFQVMFYIHPESDVTRQFWSLPYEVVFYALCPIIVLWRGFFPSAALAAVATLILKGPLLNPWDWFALNFIGNEALLFASGALAYRYFDRIPVVSMWWLLLAMPVVIAIRFVFQVSNFYSNMVVVVGTILAIRNLPRRLPRWANFGSFSYSIYIYHFALLVLLAVVMRQNGIEPQQITNPVAWAAAVPVVIALSFLLYVVTERPCNAIVANLRGRNATSGTHPSRASEQKRRSSSQTHQPNPPTQ